MVRLGKIQRGGRRWAGVSQNAARGRKRRGGKNLKKVEMCRREENAKREMSARTRRGVWLVKGRRKE